MEFLEVPQRADICLFECHAIAFPLVDGAQIVPFACDGILGQGDVEAVLELEHNPVQEAGTLHTIPELGVTVIPKEWISLVRVYQELYHLAILDVHGQLTIPLQLQSQNEYGIRA